MNKIWTVDELVSCILWRHKYQKKSKKDSNQYDQWIVSVSYVLFLSIEHKDKICGLDIEDIECNKIGKE